MRFASDGYVQYGGVPDRPNRRLKHPWLMDDFRTFAADHVARMRAELARVLEVPLECVSIKATTTDGMGFVGAGEGAAASAVALVLSTKDGET